MSAKNKEERVGEVGGIPYDFRKPTKERFKEVSWNPQAPLITKRWFGWGWSINFYAIFHYHKWLKSRAELKHSKKANKSS